jgi:hypothetical protein
MGCTQVLPRRPSAVPQPGARAAHPCRSLAHGTTAARRSARGPAAHGRTGAPRPTRGHGAATHARHAQRSRCAPSAAQQQQGPAGSRLSHIIMKSSQATLQPLIARGEGGGHSSKGSMCGGTPTPALGRAFVGHLAPPPGSYIPRAAIAVARALGGVQCIVGAHCRRCRPLWRAAAHGRPARRPPAGNARHGARAPRAQRRVWSPTGEPQGRRSWQSGCLGGAEGGAANERPGMCCSGWSQVYSAAA